MRSFEIAAYVMHGNNNCTNFIETFERRSKIVRLRYCFDAKFASYATEFILLLRVHEIYRIRGPLSFRYYV